MWQAGGSQAQAQKNVNAFKQFLAKVKSDGTVQKMIYYIYPSEQVAPGVTYWKPLMQKACEESPVPCYFIDLAPLFTGHPEYMGSDGIHPSDVGGTVVGNAVWDAMKKNVWF
jgi:lysophospholipase L1-like esterase